VANLGWALDQEREWIAARILTDKDLQERVRSNVEIVLTLVNPEFDEKDVNSIMNAVLPEVSEAVKRWGLE